MCKNILRLLCYLLKFYFFFVMMALGPHAVFDPKQ